jgi:voltage-gated potassium channel Kch
MKPRIIVCGLGRTGYKIFSLLKQQGALVVGISDSSVEVLRERLHGLDKEHEADIVVGDLRSAGTLLAAGVKEAHTLVLATRDDALNLAVLIQARVLNPRIRIISRLFNTSLGDRLDHTLPDHASMSVAALSAPVFAFAAMGNRAIGQLRLFHQIWPIHEEHIDEMHPWKGRKLTDLWEDRSRMLIYYLPVDSSLDLVSAVVEGQSLQVGDRLIIATQPSIRSFRKTFKQKFSEFLLTGNDFWRDPHLHSSKPTNHTYRCLVLFCRNDYGGWGQRRCCGTRSCQHQSFYCGDDAGRCRSYWNLLCATE